MGDASRRWTLSMPPTLAAFQSRVRKGFGLGPEDPFEMWVHPYARGATPARGRERIRNESDYRCVIDGDVVVRRAARRELLRVASRRRRSARAAGPRALRAARSENRETGGVDPSPVGSADASTPRRPSTRGGAARRPHFDLLIEAAIFFFVEAERRRERRR